MRMNFKLEKYSNNKSAKMFSVYEEISMETRRFFFFFLDNKRFV